MILACELCQGALMFAKTLLGSFEGVNNSVPRSTSATVLPLLLVSEIDRDHGSFAPDGKISQHERSRIGFVHLSTASVRASQPLYIIMPVNDSYK